MPNLVTPQRNLHVPMEVVIPKIMELGMQSRPKEACGVIVPELATPPDQWVVQMINRADTPETEYKISSATVKQLLDDMTSAQRVWDNVIIWHTHPSGMVGPSRGDMHSRIEGLTYLVVSLPNGEAVTY